MTASRFTALRARFGGLRHLAEAERLAGVRARYVAWSVVAVFGLIALKAGAVAMDPAEAASVRSGPFEAPVRRADIVDRNGELLATSVEVYSLFADPRAIWDAEATARQLADVLPDLDVGALAARLANRDRAFVWVRRGLTPRQRQAVFDLGLEGLGFRTERRRAYPRGALAGHVLGYTSVDGTGLGGLELSQEARLAEGGAPLAVTLHSGVQFALEAELARAASHHDARGGAGVLIEVGTGDVWALASWPPFDPNRAHETPADASGRLNRASNAVYELGSVFKPLTVAAALEAGVLSPSETFDTETPIPIGGFEIDDLHPIDAPASVTDIVADSSNIGTVRIAQRLGDAGLIAFLERAGLLSAVPIELPGDAPPLVPDTWRPITVATVSYGHGLAVSPLAFGAAVAALGNEGVWVAPTLLRRPQAGGDAHALRTRRLVSPDVARLVVDMMREAVRDGTGSRADVAGYRVAGKTGTAEKPVGGGYADDRNVTSFAALFPAERPQYALLIVLDDPKPGTRADGVRTGVTSAWNAAPAAGRTIERIAPLLGIAPRLDADGVALSVADTSDGSATP